MGECCSKPIKAQKKENKRIIKEVLISKPNEPNQSLVQKDFLNKTFSNEINKLYLNKESSMCKITYKKKMEIYFKEQDFFVK